MFLALTLNLYVTPACTPVVTIYVVANESVEDPRRLVQEAPLVPASHYKL
jgi:hypothetical protein